MPAKIHRPVPRSKDRNRTSPLPLKSKQNHYVDFAMTPAEVLNRKEFLAERQMKIYREPQPPNVLADYSLPLGLWRKPTNFRAVAAMQATPCYRFTCPAVLMFDQYVLNGCGLLR